MIIHTQTQVYTLSALLPLVMLLAGLAFTVWTDPYLRRDQRRSMFWILFLCTLLIVQNYTENSIASGRWPSFLTLSSAIRIRTVLAILGYSIRPMILMRFVSIVRQNQKKKILLALQVLVILNTVLYVTNYRTHLCFRISPDNRFTGGILSDACLAVSLILLLFLFIQAIRLLQKGDWKEAFLPALVVFMILAGIILDGNVGAKEQKVSFLTISVIVGTMMFYIWLHLQFVRRHERALQAEQRIQIMMSQIQPHFLYNTLTTIQALCRIDPEKAFEVTEKFGTYLRENINFLNQPDLIPLKKELEHTHIYAEIEVIRFPSIRITYEIEDEEYKVPALTIQPLVENAIRHGVRIRGEGRVTVTSRRSRKFHEIVVADNGQGFDPKKALTDDGTHIGIQNVRERIEKLCGGTLTVDSKIGEGSVITIRIPAEDRKSQAFRY